MAFSGLLGVFAWVYAFCIERNKCFWEKFGWVVGNQIRERVWVGLLGSL